MSNRSPQRFSFAQGENAAYIEQLYQSYKASPESVDPTWRAFFEGYEFAATGVGESLSAEEAKNNAKVEAFINAYRRLGHLMAHTNPLGPKPPIRPDMTPQAHGLGAVDPADEFFPANLPSDRPMAFNEIMDLLLQTYTNHVGADFREINDVEAVTWFQAQMEGVRNQPEFGSELKQRALRKLVAAEGFERFLGDRYLGQKRFSLEGCDALIPMMDVLLDDAVNQGVEEVELGMAHRGRLNVLVNVMGQTYEQLIRKFEDSEVKPFFDIDGDVKYHLGFANEVETASGKRIRLHLSPNPSHLEAVNPVVEGFARSRQRLLGDTERKRVLPILMHGDAAFMGQGLVAETLNLSQLAAYETGGTIHIITNNQVGFTTNPEEGRSTVYSSDIAKIIRAPVLHVNADDPEACIWVARLAVAYRQKFQRDIVIDLVGYRRHGHNETDEPSFTQPLMYKIIKDHPTVLELYAERLKTQGIITDEDLKKSMQTYRGQMQEAFDAVRSGKVSTVKPPVPASLQRALYYRRATVEDIEKPAATQVKPKVLEQIGLKITAVPEGFTPHPKLVRLLEARRKMALGESPVDWAFAELLGYGSLACELHHVRLDGQDVRRGTFSSRHAVLFDYETGEPYEPLNHIASEQARVDFINSPLSEQGVMGFDFGYSVADPDALVAWEAQFGDFSNGAQIVIDQFLAASEAKWQQTSGLVLLLPHGYEGQGPEHSSARPERFLQLSGNLNIQVAMPTTPAQYFHILRRQLHRDFRKPLVVMTPKSLLRHPQVVSPISDLAGGQFVEVIDDATLSDAKAVKRVVMSAGKIYYDLLEARDGSAAAKSVALVRVEQLYPFPESLMKKALARYPNATELVWAQEEPVNMGAWAYIRPRLNDLLGADKRLSYVGRVGSGTTAEGSLKAHKREQKRIVDEALGLAKPMPRQVSAIE